MLGLWSGQIPEWAAVAGFTDAETGTVFDLLQRRDAARQKKNFTEADRIRDGLAAAGVQVVDTPEGPVPEKLPTFNVNALDQVWAGQ
jgi:cysteinyl-tRNA synthetase